MALLHATSLAATVDAVNEADFFHRALPAPERAETARFIAGRLGKPGAYAGTFALLDVESREGPRVFTGERTDSAAARHIAGEEACRALRLLHVADPAIASALETATARLAERIGPVRRGGPEAGRLAPWLGGVFCCGRCSVALWRHIAVGGFDDAHARFETGLRYLRRHRTDDGRWRAFPFWYTLSALVEMDVPAAREELRHAAPVLERVVSRGRPAGPYGRRRYELARRGLGAA